MTTVVRSTDGPLWLTPGAPHARGRALSSKARRLSDPSAAVCRRESSLLLMLGVDPIIHVTQPFASSRNIRRSTTLHCMFAFCSNTTMLAPTMNVGAEFV
jgi:hypothetical protein